VAVTKYGYADITAKKDQADRLGGEVVNDY